MPSAVTRPASVLSRRHFLTIASLGPLGAAVSCRSPALISPTRSPARLFFVTGGQTVLMNADGTGRRVLEFDVPNQATWQPGGFFADGHRVLLLSMEPRRDGPGRPFEEYYTQTPTHLWTYDLDSGSLQEVATRDRLAVFYTPQLLLPGDRVLVQVVRDRVGQVFSMNLDGSDAREFTKAGEGLPCGFSLSPDGSRVAFHLAGPHGYEIWTSDLLGGNRIQVAGHPEHLYFGPQWSPDGDWLAFEDCLFREDPGHDWCDVRISRPDGREARSLTTGQSMWFGATYGTADRRGGGSNVIAWTCDGSVLFPRRLPESQVPWEYQAQRPDTDHFNRDFKPESAHGGTEIYRLDPRSGEGQSLTSPGAGFWDFRCSESGDGQWSVFCRAATGGVPALWVMDAQGRTPRELAANPTQTGVDHPRWLPQPT